MSNLKLDIIYYQTSSDFEMEFNLSGCCRMRIFKDKIETKKEFVSALAKDVSRSKIIIVVTELFGEESAIPTLSRAIGLGLTSPNKATFGIENTEEILIPETAVPLVTKAGIFGGCIIESGPQSIIIVSNMRALRHEIMKAYVHNYIFDVGQLFAYQERMGQTTVLTPVTLPTPTDTNSSSDEAETTENTVFDETESQPVSNKEEAVEEVSEEYTDIESKTNTNEEQPLDTEVEQTFNIEEIATIDEPKAKRKNKHRNIRPRKPQKYPDCHTGQGGMPQRIGEKRHLVIHNHGSQNAEQRRNNADCNEGIPHKTIT